MHLAAFFFIECPLKHSKNSTTKGSHCQVCFTFCSYYLRPDFEFIVRFGGMLFHEDFSAAWVN